jgi:hypothetical protein
MGNFRIIGIAMSTDYWLRLAYKPKYFIGDRVFGHWNKIPFVGSVGNDTVISSAQGPRITVLLDLPIVYNNKVHNIIVTKHKYIAKLVSFDNLLPVKKKTNTNGKNSIH